MKREKITQLAKEDGDREGDADGSEAEEREAKNKRFPQDYG